MDCGLGTLFCCGELNSAIRAASWDKVKDDPQLTSAVPVPDPIPVGQVAAVRRLEVGFE